MKTIIAFFVGLVITSAVMWRNAWRDELIATISVTRCRLCDKLVYVWQPRERREMNVDLQNDAHAACGVSGSCVVHRGCKGVPIAKVTVW